MKKVMLRNTVSKNIALFIPTMHAQLSFNNLAGTDMTSHLEFLKALEVYHENLRLGFYTKVFDKKPASVIDWNTHEAKFYNSKRDFSWVYVLLPTLLITMIIGVFGAINLRRL